MNELLHAAVVKLLDKLDEVSDATLGIFQMAQLHGARYTGPTYEVEYDLLRILTGTDRPGDTEHHVRSDLSGKPTPKEADWLKLVEGERKTLEADESAEFLELAESDWARAMSARFDALRGVIKELAELEKEHLVRFRPSKEWLERMFKIEDECGGHISVGGLAADLGMLPENPEKPNTFLMMGSSEPMGTMSDPSLEDLVYYMKMDGSSVRLLSVREIELADRCNSLDECPAEDPNIGECPMHPSYPEPETFEFKKTLRNNCAVCKGSGRVDYIAPSGDKINGYYRDCVYCRPVDPIMDCRV